MAVVGSKSDDRIQLKVGLSHKVRDFEKLRITVTTADGVVVQHSVTPSVNAFGATLRDITEVWQIEFPECHEFTLTVTQPPTNGANLGAIDTAQTIDGIRIFRSFSRKFAVTDSIVMQPGNSESMDVSILDQELTRLKELN